MGSGTLIVEVGLEVVLFGTCFLFGLCRIELAFGRIEWSPLEELAQTIISLLCSLNFDLESPEGTGKRMRLRNDWEMID